MTREQRILHTQSAWYAADDDSKEALTILEWYRAARLARQFFSSGNDGKPYLDRIHFLCIGRIGGGFGRRR